MADGGFENGKRERRGDNVFCSRWENEIRSRMGRRRRSYSWPSLSSALSCRLIFIQFLAGYCCNLAMGQTSKPGRLGLDCNTYILVRFLKVAKHGWHLLLSYLSVKKQSSKDLEFHPNWQCAFEDCFLADK